MTDRPRALAVLISVFLLGCILGSAGSYFWLRNRPSTISRRMMQNFPPGGPGRQRMPDLKLTPEQQQEFREIMTESRRQLDALRAEQGPKIEAIFTETDRKLTSIMTKEQQQKWADFLKERRNFRMRGPFGGPPGMGPGASGMEHPPHPEQPHP